VRGCCLFAARTIAQSAADASPANPGAGAPRLVVRCAAVPDRRYRRSQPQDALTLAWVLALHADGWCAVTAEVLQVAASRDGWQLAGLRSIRASLRRLHERGAVTGIYPEFRACPIYQQRALAAGAGLVFHRADQRRLGGPGAAALALAAVRGRGGDRGWADSVRRLAGITGSDPRRTCRTLRRLREAQLLATVGHVPCRRGAALVRRVARASSAREAREPQTLNMIQVPPVLPLTGPRDVSVSVRVPPMLAPLSPRARAVHADAVAADGGSVAQVLAACGVFAGLPHRRLQLASQLACSPGELAAAALRAAPRARDLGAYLAKSLRRPGDVWRLSGRSRPAADECTPQVAGMVTNLVQRLTAQFRPVETAPVQHDQRLPERDPVRGSSETGRRWSLLQALRGANGGSHAGELGRLHGAGGRDQVQADPGHGTGPQPEQRGVVRPSLQVRDVLAGHFGERLPRPPAGPPLPVAASAGRHEPSSDWLLRWGGSGAAQLRATR